MALLAPWPSAQVRAYADALLDILDPARELLSLRLYREHCCPIEASYTKDLSALDRKLQHLVLGPVGTYVPGAPCCTCGPASFEASCVLYAPEAQGSLPRGTTHGPTPSPYRPLACFHTRRTVVADLPYLYP